MQTFTLTIAGAARLYGTDDAPLTAAAVLDLAPGEYRWESDPCIVTMDVVLSAWGGKIVFESAGFGHRALPLSFGAVLASGPAHDGAVPVGRIDAITPDGMRVRASGVVIVGEGEADAGRQYALALANQTMTSVSVDVAVMRATDSYVLDNEGYPVDVITNAHEWSIGALTAVNMGADPDARVRLADVSDMDEETPEDAEDDETEPEEDDAEPMAAAAVGDGVVEGEGVDLATLNRTFSESFDAVVSTTPAGSLTAGVKVKNEKPPPEWFDHPGKRGYAYPSTLEANGHAYGYFAPWEKPGQKACHVGFSDRCVCAPRSPDGTYPYFASGGTVTCSDGSRPPVGVVAYTGGHPDDDGTQPWTTIKAAYDDPAKAGLLVAVGEDEHGIWYNGIVAPIRSAAERIVMQACGVSGHWRGRIQGDPHPGDRLIAACCVIAEGFPKQVITASVGPDVELPAVAQGPRAVYDGDERLVLTAATGTAPLAAAKAPVSRDEHDRLAERLAHIEAQVAAHGGTLGLLDGPARREALERLG